MSNWRPLPRPGPNTASTRSSMPGLTTVIEAGNRKVIDSLFKTYIKRATEEIRSSLGRSGLVCLRLR